MEETTKPRRGRWRFGLRGLMVAVAALGLLFAWVARDNRNPFEKLKGEWSRSERDFDDALWRSKTAEEKQQVAARLRPKPVTFADRCLDLARSQPGTPSELAALCWAATNAPTSKAGREALAILKVGRLDHARPGELRDALEGARTNSEAASSPLSPVVLEYARRHLDDPATAGLLTRVCAGQFGDRSTGPSPTFAEVADLIADRFAASPDISNFCETLGSGTGSPPWAGRYEKHLRTILDKNRTPFVRCTASFALASVVQASGEDRQDEAETLYRRFVEDFKEADPFYRNVADNLIHNARSEAAGIRARGLGKSAPGMIGVDLDGRSMSLLDYRGKVVLVSFWATWCGPCMQLIPHERALLEKFKDRPFAIVGVNGDRDPEALARALPKLDLPWRSFRDARPDQEFLSEEWKVTGWPTLFLIDRDGIVRKKWVGTPGDDVLEREIALLSK